MAHSSGDDGFPALPPPLDEALAWFARLRRPDAGTAEREKFAVWLAADPARSKAYDKVERLWRSPALSSTLNRFDEAAPAVSRPAHRRRAFPMRWAAAASVLLSVGWSLAASGWIDHQRADFATETGEQRRVMLADGSAVTLNTDSAMALEFGDGTRGVRLLRGEAYFEVQPDIARPFIVSTGNASVRVAGTRFTVQAGDVTAVNVESGIVACANGRGETRRLTAGQHTDISPGAVAAPTPVDTHRAFAWLNGRLIFHDRPLSEVLAELDRYHPGVIVVADSHLAETRVSGNYKLDDTTAVVAELAGIAGAAVSRFPYLTVLR